MNKITFRFKFVNVVIRTSHKRSPPLVHLARNQQTVGGRWQVAPVVRQIIGVLLVIDVA